MTNYEIRDNYFLTSRWEKRGWKIVTVTGKRIGEVVPAWKSSAEAEEVIDHIVDLHNSSLSE